MTADATSLDCDVAVIGCGPVGVVVAGLLAGRGLHVIALDREIDLFPLPRAAHFDQEIMRVLQELGCADAVAPSTIVNPGMDFLSADRRVLLSMRPEGHTPSGWPASILFHQPGFEHTLRDAARALGAELRLGTEVLAIDDLGDEVHLRLGGGDVLRASYVVACDGARSSARKQLGIRMDDLEFEEPWLVLDLLLGDGVAPPSELTLQVCDPARPHTLVPMPAPRFRFEFMLLPGEDAAAISSPERVRELLATWIDPDTVTVERSAVYTFHGLIATEWRRGRVLLAGDAAHQTPPFLGQGMCAGIRDAANLSWKLERVLRHGAPDRLLDTYQSEREPHVRAIVSAAVGFGRIICTTDAAVAAERDAAMFAAREAGGGRTSGTAMPPLTHGPLIRDGGGEQVRQVSVDGRRLDDLVGPNFALLVRDRAQLDAPPARHWVALGARALAASELPDVATALDEAGADAVVVRPDRYVLSAGDSPDVPAEVASLLAG